MLGSLPYQKKNLGPPLQSRKAMLETLFRHLAMVRLSATALVLLTVVGCTGLIDGGSDGLTNQERTALKKWQTSAYPVLHETCYPCHNGSRPMVEFLAGATESDVLDSIKAFDPPVVNFDAPSSSRILSKGLHDGPALTGEQSSAILQWLQAERDAQVSKPGSPTELLATMPFAIQICTALPPDNPGGTCPTNHVPLDTIPNVGTQIPGAELSFTAQALSTSLYLTNLKMSGGTAGAYLEHPLFVSRRAMGDRFPDQIDRFFALKLNIKAGTAEQLSGGTAVFNEFAATDMLEIHFKTLSAFQAGTGTPPAGGCKVLASFKTNAAPRFQTNCVSCHGGTNPNATATMNLTGVTSANDAQVTAACNEVRSRLNLTTTDQSGIYLAPDPTSGTAHPFKFPAGQFIPNFKTSVDIWVQAEKIAP